MCVGVFLCDLPHHWDLVGLGIWLKRVLRSGFKVEKGAMRFRCKLISIDPPPIQGQDLTQPSNSN